MDGAGIRRRIAAERAAGLGRPGKGFGDEVRDEAAAYATWRRAEGMSLHAIAAELDVGVSTLASWTKGTATSAIMPAFRAVQIIDERDVATGIVVYGTHGVRVEGLDVARLAELLRRLA